MEIREWIMDAAKGDQLRLFWKLFAWRERSSGKICRDILTFFLYRMAHRHGGYIGRDAIFDGRPSLPHGLHGIYISRYARIGRDCRIYQNVTIGEIGGRAPQVGARCLIGAGAVVVGGIRIGDDVRIGAGAVVSFDVPDHVTVVAVPPRMIRAADRMKEPPVAAMEDM